VCLDSSLVLGEKSNDRIYHLIYVYFLLPDRFLGSSGCIVVVCAVVRFPFALPLVAVLSSCTLLISDFLFIKSVGHLKPTSDSRKSPL